MSFSLPFKSEIGDAVSKVQFAPNSNNLLISSWDSNLRLYDPDKFVCRLEAHSRAALLDCCFESEVVALSAGSDGCIRRYDLNSGANAAIGSHSDIATCVRYSHETGQVVSGSLDKNIMFWDMRLENSPSFVTNLGAAVLSMSVSGFDLMLAVGKSVSVYDLRKMERPVHLGHSFMDTQIRCIRSFPYRRGYAVGSVDGQVSLKYLDSSNPNEGYTFLCHPKSRNGRAHLVSINDIVFSPLVLGNFVTADDDGYVTAWHDENKKRLCEFPRYPNSVASLSFNHSGELLAIACSYTLQEAADEIEKSPQIFIQKMDGS